MRRSVCVGVIVASWILLSCGKSLYKPLSSNGSDEALKEDAIIALDEDNFSLAESKLKKLWNKDKSNEISQLYSVAILGQGQFVLFDVIKNAILLAAKGSDSKSGGTDIMNQLATKSAEILGGEVTAARQSYALRALDVLQSAQDQSDSGLTFQKCVTAGIYAVPVFQAVTRIQETLTSIQKTQASADLCANAATVATTEASLTAVIGEASQVTESLASIGEALDSCLPKEKGAQVNAITSRVQGILSAADKGCSIDSGAVKVGQITLPVCLNSAVSSTVAEAAAGDGVIAGCELFLHCGGGSCF